MTIGELFGGLFSALDKHVQYEKYNRCLRNHEDSFSPTLICMPLEPDNFYHSPFGW